MDFSYIEMGKLFCEWSGCEELARKFCLNCKKYICGPHRTEEVSSHRNNKEIEHYHIDALEYSCDEERFDYLYCKENPEEILTHRCINCLQFGCKSCPPQWCPRAAVTGRYHDYQKITDFVDGFRAKIIEFQRLVERSQGVYKLQLKRTCIKRKEIDFKLQELLKNVNERVEIQVALVREEGERLKEEIVQEMSQITRRITEISKSIEQKESTSRKLLQDIRELLKAEGIFIVKNYGRIKEETAALINSEREYTLPLSLDLILGTNQQSLGITLVKTEACQLIAVEKGPMVVTDETPEKHITEITHSSSSTSEMQDYRGVSFIGEEKVFIY